MGPRKTGWSVALMLAAAACSKSKERPPPLNSDEKIFDAAPADAHDVRCESGDESPQDGRFDPKKLYLLGRVANTTGCNDALVAADDFSKGLASFCGADGAMIRPKDGALFWTRHGDVYRWVPDGWDGAAATLPAPTEDNDQLLVSCGYGLYTSVYLVTNHENGELLYGCSNGDGLHELPSVPMDASTPAVFVTPDGYALEQLGYRGTSLLWEKLGLGVYAIYSSATDALTPVDGLEMYFLDNANRGVERGYLLGDGLHQYRVDFEGRIQQRGVLHLFAPPEMTAYETACAFDGCESYVCLYNPTQLGSDPYDPSAYYVVEHPADRPAHVLHKHDPADVVVPRYQSPLVGAL
jgi:hypothetical protein